MNSLKKYLVVIGISIISISVTAQNLSYGVQAGANFAVQSPIGDIYDNDDVRTGFNIGVFSNYKLTNNLSLQAELNYDEKGSKYDEAAYAYNYLTLPVMCKYKLYNEPNSKAMFDFYAGAYMSFLLSAEKDFDSSEMKNVDLTDDTNNVALGILYGFTFKYPVFDNYVLMNLRFGLDVSPYDKHDSDLKNKYMGLSVGYEF